MKKTFQLMMLVLGTVIIMLSSCKKDDENPPITPHSNIAFDKGSAKTASFFGTVTNESNSPVSGATVKIGNKTTTTNADGIFFVENASVFERLAYVKVEKSGFFLGSRSLVPTNGVNNVTIKLLPKTNIGVVNATSGGQVSGNGITIDFVGGFVDSAGNPYTGTVQVAAQYIDPEADDFSDIMPGNLIAVNQTNQSQYLQSFGMVAVELSNGSGGKLQLAEGSNATVSFPLSASLGSSAPATIDLWSFDEAGGYWIHEGTATKQGNEYLAEVSHFSFWNCDIPTEYTTINGRVVDINGNGIGNTQVRLVSTGFGTAYGYTDNQGYFGGIIPANNNLTLEVLTHCGNYVYTTIYSENIGSFSGATTLPNTVVTSLGANTLTITGTVVDCDNNPVQNGYVSYENNQVQYLTNGEFTIITCSANSVSISAFDLDATSTSGTLTYNTTNETEVNVGQIVACNNLSEYIIWSVGNQNFLTSSGFLVSSQGSFVNFGGNSPNYAYFNIQSGFNGIGTYNVSNNLEVEGVFGISTDMQLEITQWGANSGELIEGTFGGTVLETDSINGTTTTQIVNGSIHFLRP